MLRDSIVKHVDRVIETKSLPDTGATLNLISDNLVKLLELQKIPLKKVIRIDSVSEQGALRLRHKVRTLHGIGTEKHVEEFVVAPLIGEPQVILGRPWLEKHVPRALDLIENYGAKATVSVGGEKNRYHRNCASETCKVCREERLGAVKEEENWRKKVAERRKQVLLLRAEVCMLLEAHEEASQERVFRAAVAGDPGIRGLTGNKEGWRETIPQEFRAYTETVFSDSVLREAAPARPGFECVITLKEGESLTKHKPYELSPLQLQNLKALLDNEEKAGVLRRSKAPHAAPGFFVTDPGSKQERWVVDYREVNQKKVKDAYPLPRINTIIERAAGAKFISTLDISKAFAMIPMEEKSKLLTAFTTPLGMYEYNVMPMGLANAPSVWQRFIDSILGPISHSFVFAYLDDLLIVSKTREEHVQHVKQVLEILEKHGLHAKPHKCHWFQKEVEFLGFKVIAEKGVTMADDKVQAIRDMQPPRRVKDLRMLLGVFGFNEKFAKHYSDLTACMTDLLKKDVPWEWTPRHQDAFEELKRRFEERILLTAFDPEKPIRMKTDASDVSHAVWIEQPKRGLDGDWQPILLASHKFKDAEKGWDGPDKELFAIVDAFRRYRKWLGQPKFPVQVFSDHRNLAKFMFTSNLLKSHDGRLGRWWLELSQCNFVIQYTPGVENVEADWLSRYNLEDSVDLDPKQLLGAYRFAPKALADICEWFRRSPDAQNIRKKLESSFAHAPKRDNEKMAQLLEQHFEKLNDSPDPVPDPAQARMASAQRQVFGTRYRVANPQAPNMDELVEDLQQRAQRMQGI